MNYNPIFFITGATLDTDKVVLTVTGNPTIAARGVARFLFAPNVAVPTGAVGTNEVVLSIDGTEYTLLDKFAMPLTLSELPVGNIMVSGSVLSMFATRRTIICGISSDGATPAVFSFVAWNLPVPSEFIIPLR